MTPTFSCGLECGIFIPHFQAVGSPAIVTSPVRSGANALQVNPSAGIEYAYVRGTLVNTNTPVARIYLYIVSHPTTDAVVCGPRTASFVHAGLAYKSSDGKYYAGSVAGGSHTFGATGVTLTTATWYRVDLKVVSSANPWLVDVQVDGTACGQCSVATAAEVFDDTNGLVVLGSITSETYEMSFDDIVVSNTAGDYPIGAGYVNRFIPTSDGTHNIAGAGDFERGNSGTDILNASTTAFNLIDDVPLPSGTVDEADCQRAVAPPNATDYPECVFGPAAGVSTPTVAPRAVEVVLAHHQIATQTGSMRVALNDNGTTDDVLALVGAAGVVTYRYARKHYALAPTGGAWTVAAGAGNFNNIRSRFLSADPAPDQCLDAIMIEAEFAEVAKARPPYLPRPQFFSRRRTI